VRRNHDAAGAEEFGPRDTPALPLLLVMGAYSILIAFIAGRLIARLAPLQRVAHAAIYAACRC
jgi:hypothetical protein